jgi:hypothetical protein
MKLKTPYFKLLNQIRNSNPNSNSNPKNKLEIRSKNPKSI